MDLDDIVKEVDGKLVTKIDIDPPTGWTNDFDAIKGYEWAEDGSIAEVIEGLHLKAKPKPLFGKENGDGQVIFQAGDELYLHYLDTEDVYRIKDYSDPELLVSVINDSRWDELELVDPRYSLAGDDPNTLL
ncbi:uncharacterized protein FTJAE_11485 [Fusarium tjaetaba]|uniref:Uncharacterized protein n=1 Tax=Fusarium tjaetaba TaxID=1567544 RepID=A0A8H5QTT1_9HYPO|nr:uncharacterized protein FTJAE_11485 [Fusarium tjaetaba]KAF5621144.1 hypothetical protein FTJAE_11485 [Fusarium tjaetaba]